MKPGLMDHVEIEWLNDSHCDDPACGLAPPLLPLVSAIPYPEGVGQGQMESLPLFDGLVLLHATHRFAPRVRPAVLPLGRFKLEFPSPSFCVSTLQHGMTLSRLLPGGREFQMRPGDDLFRLCQQQQFVHSLNTSSDIEITTLLASDLVLQQLLGPEIAGRLLHSFGLEAEGATRLHSVPRHVTEPLWQSMHSRTGDRLHALYAQSKVLEYLWNLARLTDDPGTAKGRVGLDRATLWAVHDYLAQLDGALPKLGALARRFGVSVLHLNQGFMQEFGQSVYGWVTEYRLEQAYQALRQGSMPIKVLSHRLGYSHPNHFSYAFKRRFGCTPGSLRAGYGQTEPAEAD